MLNVKDDYGSPWLYHQEQPSTMVGTPNTFTNVSVSSSSCNSYSPLNECSAAGMFFQDEDLISISSSLDHGGSNSDYYSYNGNPTAPTIAEDVDEDDLFPGTSGLPLPPLPLTSPRLYHDGHHYEQQVSPPPTFQEHEQLLLDSVVKSKIDELAGVLEVDIDDDEDMGVVLPTPTTSMVVGNGTSSESSTGSSGLTMVLPESPTTSEDSNNYRQEVGMGIPPTTTVTTARLTSAGGGGISGSGNTMGPPAPRAVGTGLLAAPQPESLSTVQSHLYPVPLSFPGWRNPASPMFSQQVPLWNQPQAPHSRVQASFSTSHQDPQVQLVHLLIFCAQKVAIEDMQQARVILAGLKQLTSPDGTPMERLASYFAEALGARIERKATGSVFRGLVSDNLLEADDGTQTSMLEAFSSFYDYLPIGKFDHLTMNQVILDAVEKEREVHILDLHLWIGTQWPALLHALANRPGGPPKVKITAIGSASKDLIETGKKLAECARTLKVKFEYCHLVVTNLLEDFNASMVTRHQGEAFIVNSLSKFHYLLGEEPPAGTTNGNSKFNNFLRQIRILAPKVLVMAENDANHNSPIFLHRFSECLKYYSAVFDAMATCMSSPTGRARMERLFAAPKIRNIVACDGRERVERHEGMGDWVRRLEGAGFRPVPLSARAVNQAKLLLRLYYTNGYTLHNERGYLVLGWRTLPLNTVSAWRS